MDHQEVSKPESATGNDGAGNRERLVLLVNLGTPDAPDTGSVRRYLREFLSDPRVIEVPRVIWWFVLNGVILVFRPRRVAALYASVWGADSPIRRLSVSLAARLQAHYETIGQSAMRVLPAMTYGKPSLREILVQSIHSGVRDITVVPMYPQYSATTTAAVYDQVAKVMRGQRDLPALRLVRDYHLHPLYIAALAGQVREHWNAQGRGERLLMSFHGLPQDYVDRGDPYARECQATASALAQALSLQDGEWFCSFQSRFGPRAWLQPYTDKVLQEWGQSGIGRVDVICPGFAVDCLETLEEIAVENRQFYQEAGGGDYHYIPALNDSDAQVRLLAAIVSAAN